MDFKTATNLVVLSTPFFLLTIWAIVNAAQKDFGSTGKKVQWCLVAAIPYVGFLIYLLFGFRKGRKPNAAQNIN